MFLNCLTEYAGGRQVVLLPAAPGTCDDTVTSVCLRTLELHRWSCTVGFAGSRQWRQCFGHALPAPGFLWGARGQAVGCWVTTAGLSQHRLCVGSLPWGERALQFSPPLEQHSSVAGSAHSGVFLVLRPPPCARWDLVTSTCRSDTVVGGCATVKTGRRAVRLQAAPVWGHGMSTVQRSLADDDELVGKMHFRAPAWIEPMNTLYNAPVVAAKHVHHKYHAPPRLRELVVAGQSVQAVFEHREMAIRRQFDPAELATIGRWTVRRHNFFCLTFFVFESGTAGSRTNQAASFPTPSATA